MILLLDLLRSIVGIFSLIGFAFAVVWLIVFEWNRIRLRKPGFVPLFHRVRRIITGLLMIVLLGLSFYGWWFLDGDLTIQSAEVFLKAIFSLLAIIFLSLLWDCVVVYRSLDSFFDRVNKTNTLEGVVNKKDESREVDSKAPPGKELSRDTPD